MSKIKDVGIRLGNVLHGSKRKTIGHSSLETFVKSLIEPKPITLPAHSSLTTADLGKFVVNYNGQARVSFLDGADPGNKGQWTFEFGTDLDLPVPAEFSIKLNSNPTNGESLTFYAMTTASFGTNVEIGATVEESRDNLLAWISLNLNPVASQTHVASGTDTIILTLDGNQNNWNILYNSANFVQTSFEGTFTVTLEQSWEANIYDLLNSNQVFASYYDAETTVNITYQGMCSAFLVPSWNVKNWYGYNFPVTKEDWAAALAGVINQNLYLNNATNVSASSLGNIATIVEDNVVSSTNGGQFNIAYVPSYGASNIIHTVVQTPTPALPNRLRYPVLGILSKLNGGVATVETPEIVDYKLQSDHSFVLVDPQNIITAFNDFYVVWDNGEIIRFLDLILNYPQILSNQGTYLELLVKTYLFKALEEGLAGEKIRLDKFPIFVNDFLFEALPREGLLGPKDPLGGDMRDIGMLEEKP